MSCVRKSRVCAMLTCMAVLTVAQMAEAQTTRARTFRAQTFKAQTFSQPATAYAILQQQGLRPAGATSTTIENDPVYRLQMRVKTANVKDANTDDSVKVSLGSLPGTWLDLSIDDRERGKTNLYDINLLNTGSNGVKIRDLRSLNISKTGSDGWCIETIELLVNGRVIYKTTFPGGQWLDNSKGLKRSLIIGSRALRANAKWKQYTSPGPSFLIKRLELEQRIESIIGHHIHADKRVKWGKLYGRGVEVSYVNSKTLHVDLDLMLDVKGLKSGLDFDFDILVSSRNGAIDLTVTNFKTRIGSKIYKAILAANGFLGGSDKGDLKRLITSQVRNSLGGRPVSVSTGDFTLTAKVTSAGDLRLGL